MITVLFVLGHTFFNTCANICFKLSALSLRQGSVLGPFLWWQVAGNLAGFAGVLSYTFSMRYLPLHIAYPLTQGLAVLGVSLLAGRLIFQEVITPLQWLGVLLIGIGIGFIGFITEIHKEDAVVEITAGTQS